MMHGEDPPSSRSLPVVRNPFDDDEDDGTSLSSALDPPRSSLPTIRSSSSSRSTKSMSELRKTRSALIGGHNPNDHMSEQFRNEEISVAESQQDDLESCPPDSDYASRGPSLITSGSGGIGIGQSTSRGSSNGSSAMYSLAASVKSSAASLASLPIRVPTFKSQGYRSPSNTHKSSSSVSRMRYGTNLSPHAEEYEDKPGRRKFIVVALVILSVVLIGAIIAVAVVIFGGNDSSSSPAISPETAAAREQALDKILVRVSSADTLIDPTSPQAKARHWLLYEDTLWMHPAQAIPGERVIQRYILAVFYFSTGGQTMWSENNWLEGDECHNAKGEYWTGLACNDDDKVLAIAFGKCLTVRMGDSRGLCRMLKLMDLFVPHFRLYGIEWRVAIGAWLSFGA